MSNLASYVPDLNRPNGSSDYHPERKDFFDFVAFLLSMWRRRTMILRATGAFTLLVAIATILTPKSYTTTAVLIAGNPSVSANSDAGTTLPVLNALVLRSGAASAETFAAVAQQEDVARDVARKLRLAISPNALLSHLTVKPVPNTALLNVSAKWKSPASSARITNAFAGAFISREREFVRAQAEAAIGFLTPELPRAQLEMHQTSQALADFESATGYADGQTHTQDFVGKVASLEAKIDTLTLDRREQQALLDNATAQLSNTPGTLENSRQISSNPVVADLRSRLSAVQVQLASALDQYTEHHPLVVSLKKQRDELIAQIARQPQNMQSGTTLAPNPIYQSLLAQIADSKQKLDGDNAQLAIVRSERAALEPQLRALPKETLQLTTLQQRAKVAADVYSALQSKYNDAKIAAETAISDISVIQGASADAASVSPDLRINLAIAIVVGLFLSAIVVFVLDLLDGTVRDQGAAQALTGLSVLARIPSLDAATPKALSWLQSMTVEAFFQLCVALKLKNQRTLRVLAITSPCRGDGKSTVAFNLAKAMSSLTGGRVLLVDADLRRPTLHELAGTTNETGLRDVLGRNKRLDQAVVAISKGFDLLPAEPGCENPVGLIDSAEFLAFLTEARTLYSTIVVDTPALSAVSDALIVSARADATVLVVSANATGERSTREAVAQFSAVGIDNVIGIVLNRDAGRMNDYSDYFAQSAPAMLPHLKP